MSNKLIKITLICSLVFASIPLNSYAKKLLDTDKDGVPDKDELAIYHTDIYKRDTDGDGYSDWIELNNGYSPHNKNPVKLEDHDYDNDGLTDKMELAFNTDLTNPDSDNDSFSDGVEINNGYNPLDNNSNARLEKRIEVNTGSQELHYFLGGVRMGKFIVSTGVASMPTPKGHLKIDSKHPRAWSSYGLWMPYWMSIQNGRIGIHELPEWPNGHKEGEDHLGTPASHGCIRLGTGPAEFLYNWAEIGTPVFVY